MGVCLTAGGYLSEAAVREMTRRQTPPALAESYGLGWNMYADDSRFGHGGACATNMTIDAHLGLITVFLVQVAGLEHVGEAHEAFRRSAEERFGEPLRSRGRFRVISPPPDRRPTRVRASERPLPPSPLPRANRTD